MGVKLMQIEPSDFSIEAYGDIEDCVICGCLTTMWWGDGCCPLCHGCAEDTFHEEMVAISKATGHGPIPEENTDYRYC